MWLVAKHAKNAAGCAPIEPALTDTLRIWYSGQGDHRDEEAALMLVRHARKHGQWLACDCQGDELTPMLSPALLTGADTYYLRRLTGPSRSEHRIDCPFFREQSLTTLKSDKRPARNPPEGFFSVLRLPAISLAQEPDSEPTLRDSASHGAPRLAKLLWRLLELSGRTTIASEDAAVPDIAHEFAAIRKVAEQIDVAPGIALSRVLFTHPRDWTSRKAFAVLREVGRSWPKGHEPQAFLLLFGRKIHERSIETADGTIELGARLRHPGTRLHPISGPDLTLVAIGEHPDLGGYRALRAWAQPVVNGHRFIPVDRDFDRDLAAALIAARRLLAQDGISLTATKPLFDSITRDGPVRPSWTVQLAHQGEKRTLIIEPGPFGKNDAKRRSALSFLAPVIEIDPDNLPYFTARLKSAFTKE